MSRPINKTRNLFRQSRHTDTTIEAKSRRTYQVQDKIATGKLTPGASENSGFLLLPLLRDTRSEMRIFFPNISHVSLRRPIANVRWKRNKRRAYITCRPSDLYLMRDFSNVNIGI